MKVKDLLLVLIIGGCALFIFNRYKANQAQQEFFQASAKSSKPETHPVTDNRLWLPPQRSDHAELSPASTSSSSFKCDGRTHCSQMRSCDEAKFFIKNCPNTQMDGDNDGIPCERQWCS